MSKHKLQAYPLRRCVCSP